MNESIKTKTAHGVFWSGLERFSVQGIQFALAVVMARLLDPSDYGVVGMTAVFLSISQVLIDSGFSNALIRKQDRTETDFSTVFYFNIGVGVFFCLALFFAAPFIAGFYNTPILVNVTRTISLNLPLNSLGIVQRTKLTIRVDFKTQAKAGLAAAVLSGAGGLVMARAGFGVWALVFQSVLNAGLNAVFLWVFVPWKPLPVFSLQSFRNMFSYGSKLVVSALIDTAYKNIYTIVIGKRFAAADLGCYTRADQFAQFPSSNLTGIFQRVTFPILSGMQDDGERLGTAYRQYLRMAAFIVFPLMCGLAAVAGPLVLLVLSGKWSGVVVPLRLLCFSFMWYPVHAINLNLLQVKGRSDLFLRLEIIKKCAGVMILCVTVPLGMTAMCAGTIVSSIVALVINTHYTGKLIAVGFVKQMRDLLPILGSSLLMASVAYCVSNVFSHAASSLSCGVISGAACYLLINGIAKSKELKLLIKLVQRKP